MQAPTISDVQECDVKALSRGFKQEQIPRSCQVSINLLTLKLYDALETFSIQFRQCITWRFGG